MITGLRTNNFRKLESFSCTFTDGTNLIFGENGEGKTTAFEAFRFALFGTKAVSGTSDSLTTWNKTGMWVELDIHGYTVRRTIGNCKITDADGEVHASGNSPCTRFMEDILGCSLNDFDLLYMSKQGETAGLITFGATGLNRKVEEYAGVAVIDKVIKSLGSDIHGIQIALESFEFESTDDLKIKLDDAESKGKHAASEVDRLNTLRDHCHKEMTESQRKLSEANKFNRTQDELAENNKLQDRKITEAKAALKAAEESLAEIELEFSQVENVSEEEIENLKNKITAVRTASKQLGALRDEAELAADIKAAEDSSHAELRYNNETPSLEEAVTKAKDKVSTAKETHGDNIRAYRIADKAAENGVCGECKRPLEDHDPEAAEAKRTETSIAVSQSRTILDIAESNLSETEKALKAHHRTNPGSGWSDKVAKLQVSLDTVRQSRADLESQLANMELEETLSVALNTLLLEQKEYRRLDTATTKATVAVSNLEGRVDRLLSVQVEPSKPKVDTSLLSDVMDENITELANANLELNNAASEHATLTQLYKSVRSSFTTAEANNKKMAELEDTLNTSKELRKYLNDERVKFMDGVWRTILGTASHFIDKSTGGWITQVGRNEKGDFTFFENGIEAVAKESASGAQKAFIGTAIKVGLAQAKMGSNSMVLLDEPTADMRDDRASQLASGLMMLSGQKIMITHRDSERMIAQNIIQVGA